MIEQSFNHYRILKKLGEGGMGEVYLAHDTRLERRVALKFLSLAIPADTATNRRFRQEAKAAASLNHPYIVTVHEIGEYDSRSYIAMEYVDGESLRDLMAREELLIKRILDIFCQICEGLQKAHEAGIVHRDLKPENIMVDSDGKVRILDFGVAKFKSHGALPGNTTSFGSIAYMSPERCEGHAVDERADIWALGVMLYEMLTSRLPFEGDHEVAVLYSIVNEERRRMSDYRVDISEQLQRIVDKALAKDREQRYQDITDLRVDLELEGKRIEPAGAKTKRIKRTLAITAAIVVLLALSLAYLSDSPSSADVLPIHRQVTFTGDAGWPAISGDGQFMAYVTGKPGSNQQVFVQSLDEAGQPLAIYDAGECAGLRWSPDGSELALNSLDSTLRTQLISVPEGHSRVANAGDRVSWSPDGTQIASVARPWEHFRIADRRSGERVQVYLPGAYNWLRGSYNWIIDIDWSPLGNRLVILTRDINKSTIWTTKIDGSQQQKVVEDSLALASPRWSGNGEAIYYLQSAGQTKNLMRLKISSGTGKARGKPLTLLAGLAFGDHFTISADNERLLYTRTPESNNLKLVTLKDNDGMPSFETKQITNGTSWIHDPAVSPDGKMVALSIGKPPRANLFVMPLQGGTMRQLTFLNSYNSGAVWSPDGREIAFGSSEGGIPRVWKISASGGKPHPFLNSELSGEEWFSLAWAPGTHILYQRPGQTNYHFLNHESGEEWPLVKRPRGWMFLPRYSPDGKNVAVYHNIAVDYSTPDYEHVRPDYGPDYGLWLISLDGGADRRLYKAWLFPIKWSADGKWIYAWDWEKKVIYKVPLDGGKPEKVTTLPFDIIKTTIDMTPDETQFIVPVLDRRSDVWLVEHFDPENELEEPLNVQDVSEMDQLVYLQKGRGLKRRGKYREAEEVLRHGLEVNSDNICLLGQVGWALYHQKRFKEAEAAFGRCLEIAPGHIWILNAIRRAAFYAKDYQAAKRYNEEFMEGIIRPDKKVPILILLGAIDLVMKDYQGAEKQFYEALSIDSTSAPAYLHLGYLFAVQGHFSEALSFSEKAVSLDSSFATCNLLAWVLIAGELDIDRGLILAERVLDSRPPHAILEVAWENEVEAYSYYATPEHTLGLAYFRKGEFEKALRYFEQAVDFYPQRKAFQEDLQLVKQKPIKVSLQGVGSQRCFPQAL